jgi:hypothetical protein
MGDRRLPAPACQGLSADSLRDSVGVVLDFLTPTNVRDVEFDGRARNIFQRITIGRTDMSPAAARHIISISGSVVVA